VDKMDQGIGGEVSLLQGSFPPQLFILLLQVISEVYVKSEEYSTSLLVIREYTLHFASFPKALVPVVYFKPLKNAFVPWLCPPGKWLVFAEPQLSFTKLSVVR